MQYKAGTLPLVDTVKVVLPPPAEKLEGEAVKLEIVGIVAAAKFAVTLVAELTGIVQTGLLPKLEQAPLQPVKLEPTPAVAVKVTDVPLTN